MSEQTNGRVAIKGPDVYTSHEVALKGDNLCFQGEALRGTFANNEVSDLFFSGGNVEALQQGIRYLVYQKSCQRFVIDRQSEDELKIIMRSIYLQHSRNTSYHVVEQVRELNAKVLDFTVPRIMREIGMQLEYRRQVSQLPDPMPRAINTSIAGTKTLEMKEF